MKKNRADRYRAEEVVTAAALLAPATVILVVFSLYPILSAGYISLTSWNGFTPRRNSSGLATT